jgi:hypothetical protein
LKDRLLLFTLLLCGTELYQYQRISESFFIEGDFSIPLKNPDILSSALGLALLTWTLPYLLERLTRRKEPSRLVIPDSNWILLIFVANLVITVVGDVGHSIRASHSALSILTTLVPIHYLILVMGSQKLTGRFVIASVLYGSTELYRVMLGGFFKLFYLYIVRARRLMLMSVLLMPVGYLVASTLIDYKFEQRGLLRQNTENFVLDSVTRRIASVTSFAYGLDDSTGLALACHEEPYASQFTAAFFSVIPKRMFGLDFVKTYNNCLIEHRLGRPVDDSSVNSPWLLNLTLTAKYNALQLLSYLLLTVLLLCLTTTLSNFLLGENASIFKYWIYVEFFWTGNILQLTIPTYFLILLLVFYQLQRPALRHQPKIPQT